MRFFSLSIALEIIFCLSVQIYQNMRMLLFYFLGLLAVSYSSVNALPGFAGRRDTKINAASPFDHSWIDRFAAIGDSYTMGLGAGHPIKAANNVRHRPRQRRASG